MIATATPIRDEAHDLLKQLGVPASAYSNGPLIARTPITGEELARIPTTSPEAAATALTAAHKAFESWRNVPAPKRGELVRLLGEELRANVEPLGRLVTLEAGKILSEGLGEVQEMIDICTFAAGLSRQLAGLTIASERANHRMMETWHPLGVVGIISAFNFPVAVWSWNAALALVCGNSIVWKPSEKTPLTALATQALFERARQEVRRRALHAQSLATLLIGDATLGELLVDSPLVPLVSATGSTAMGRAVAPRLAARFARAILELGGNNAAIVAPPPTSTSPSAPSPSPPWAPPASAAPPSAASSSTNPSTTSSSRASSRSTPPSPSATRANPTPSSAHSSTTAPSTPCNQPSNAARSEGATITGGERIDVNGIHGSLLRPPRARRNRRSKPTSSATRPSLPSSTSSSTATSTKPSLSTTTSRKASPPPSSRINLREAERFLSAAGSDCGIANVNIGTSGAEIGGAFGGEKETGGGRESGSDAWKQYMRRATNTINYGTDLPLAQGVSFDID